MMDENKEEVLRIRKGFKNYYDLYDFLLFFYNGLFLEEDDILLFTTRKAYDMYLLFEPLIQNKTEKIVLTDKSLYFMKKFFKNKKIAIIDDNFVFGRTVKKIKDKLIQEFEVKEADITIRVLTKNKEADIPEDIKTCLNFYSEADINESRRRVKVYIDAISNSLTPYVSYVPAYTMSLEEFDKGFQLSESWKSINISDKKTKIKTTVYYEEKSNFEFYGVRTYESKELNRVLLIPIVILKTIKTEDVDSIYKKVHIHYEKIYLDDKNDSSLENVNDYVSQMYLITYHLSEICFNSFIDAHFSEEVSKDINEVQGILKHNFGLIKKQNTIKITLDQFLEKINIKMLDEVIMNSFMAEPSLYDFLVNDVNNMKPIFKREGNIKDKLSYFFNYYGEKDGVLASRRDDSKENGLTPILLNYILKSKITLISGDKQEEIRFNLIENYKKEEIIANLFYVLDSGKAGLSMSIVQDNVVQTLHVGEGNFNYLLELMPAFCAALTTLVSLSNDYNHSENMIMENKQEFFNATNKYLQEKMDKDNYEDLKSLLQVAKIESYGIYTIDELYENDEENTTYFYQQVDKILYKGT